MYADDDPTDIRPVPDLGLEPWTEPVFGGTRHPDSARVDDAYYAPVSSPVGVVEETRRSRFQVGRTRTSEGVDLASSEALRGYLGGTRASELRAESITAWFGSHKVLDRVSLDVPAGQVTALIGPSGCGKSTFLRILNRMHELIPIASLDGRVVVGDQDIYAPGLRVTDVRRKIGMVFQKPNPFPAMSIYENTITALELNGIRASRAERDFLVEEALRKASLWDEVKDRLHMPGGGLSGGQQQRLCIARAMALKPEILLMDEPASALDPGSTLRIEETIADLRGEVTIVIVTHNMQQALRVSDKCAFFLASAGTPGVIVEHGDTEAVFGHPRDQRTNDYVNGRFG